MKRNPEPEIIKYLKFIRNKIYLCTKVPGISDTDNGNWKINHHQIKAIIDDPLLKSNLVRTKTTPREAMHIV